MTDKLVSSNGGSYVGGIAAYCINCSLTSVGVHGGQICTYNNYAGGILGYAQAPLFMWQSYTHSGLCIYIKNYYGGGLIAYINSATVSQTVTIIDCYSYIKLNPTGRSGGLIAEISLASTSAFTMNDSENLFFFHSQLLPLFFY